MKKLLIIVLSILFVSCDSYDERYDVGYDDGYAAGYNTTCQIRATLELIFVEIL